MSDTEPPVDAKEIIKAVRSADILQCDWTYSIISALPLYWRGYFNCFIGEVGESLGCDTEDFRDEVISRMAACWNLEA